MTVQHTQRFRKYLTTWLRDPEHSKRWLSRESGVSRSHLDKIVDDDCDISIRVAGNIAEAIGVPLAEMIGEK